MRFPWITNFEEVQHALDEMANEFEQAARRGLATDWRALMLGAGWQHNDPRQPLQARRNSAGTVSMAGELATLSPPVGSTVMAYLLEGAAPRYQSAMLCPAITSASGLGAVMVWADPDGTLRYQGPIAGTTIGGSLIVFLDGMRYEIGGL